MKIQVHEKEIPSIKFLSWLVGSLGTILLTILSAWMGWISLKVIGQGEMQISQGSALSSIQEVIASWEKGGIPVHYIYQKQQLSDSTTPSLQ